MLSVRFAQLGYPDWRQSMDALERIKKESESLRTENKRLREDYSNLEQIVRSKLNCSFNLVFTKCLCLRECLLDDWNHCIFFAQFESTSLPLTTLLILSVAFSPLIWIFSQSTLCLEIAPLSASCPFISLFHHFCFLLFLRLLFLSYCQLVVVVCQSIKRN